MSLITSLLFCASLFHTQIYYQEKSETMPKQANITITYQDPIFTTFEFLDYRGLESEEVLLSLVFANFNFAENIYIYDQKNSCLTIKDLQNNYDSLRITNKPDDSKNEPIKVYYTVNTDYITTIKNQFCQVHFSEDIPPYVTNEETSAIKTQASNGPSQTRKTSTNVDSYVIVDTDSE